MCGRFNVSSTPGLQALLDSLGSDLILPPPRYNIAPTESVSLLRGPYGEVELIESRWWLTPHWAKEQSQKYSMFNARCESLSKSPAFRKPFAGQRGIVPMSAFIEWRGAGASKEAWLITNEQQGLAAAALWDVWTDGERGNPVVSCAIVTTAAPESFQPWHNRMPVMLASDEMERWLDNDRRLAADDPLFRAELKEPLRLLPLDRAVGNSRNKDPSLHDPVGDAVELEPDAV